MPMNPRLLRPLARLAEEASAWFAGLFDPTFWHWSE